MSLEEKKEVQVSGKMPAGALVSEMAMQDKTPWYKKPNLRILYLVFLPTCLGVEMTSGYVVFCVFCRWGD
jgi:hypothetical protein